MWDIVKDTSMRAHVADPARGSMHNYGSAVVVTLVDLNGVPLDMGTPIDLFGPLAEPRRETEHLASGRLRRIAVVTA